MHRLTAKLQSIAEQGAELAAQRLRRWARRDPYLSKRVDDLVAEAGWLACRRAANYDPSRPIEGWAASIALSVIREARRNAGARLGISTRRHPVDVCTLNPEDERDQLVDPSSSTEDRIEAADLLEHIARYGEDLAALAQVELLGCTYAEVAAARGVPESTMHSRIARTRSRARQILAEAS